MSVYVDEKMKAKPVRCIICGERKGMTMSKAGTIGGEFYSGTPPRYIGWMCWRKECVVEAFDREWELVN